MELTYLDLDKNITGSESRKWDLYDPPHLRLLISTKARESDGYRHYWYATQQLSGLRGNCYTFIGSN